MHRKQPLSGTEIVVWATVGMGTGLVAGFALSEWIGGVSPHRVRRAAARLRQPAPVKLTPAAAARAVEVALAAEPRLGGLSLEAIPCGRAAVELRGWVPSRAARTLAGRLALAVAGVDRVINRILVHGEDDRATDPEQVTDQSA